MIPDYTILHEWYLIILLKYSIFLNFYIYDMFFSFKNFLTCQLIFRSTPVSQSVSVISYIFHQSLSLKFFPVEKVL